MTFQNYYVARSCTTSKIINTHPHALLASKSIWVSATTKSVNQKSQGNHHVLNGHNGQLFAHMSNKRVTLTISSRAKETKDRLLSKKGLWSDDLSLTQCKSFVADLLKNVSCSSHTKCSFSNQVTFPIYITLCAKVFDLQLYRKWRLLRLLKSQEVLSFFFLGDEKWTISHKVEMRTYFQGDSISSNQWK